MRSLMHARILVLSWLVAVLARLDAAWRRLAMQSQLGGGVVEYALVLGVIAVIGLAALQALGVSLTGVIDRVINRLALLG